MDGRTFVNVLLEQLDCTNDNQLSKKLGVSAPTIGNWRKAESLKEVVVKKAFQKALQAKRVDLFSGCIKAIVEFRALDLLHGHRTDSLRRRINNQTIVARLQNAKGIYSFYDSRGHIIYCGKTAKKLMVEMNQAWGLSRRGYRRKIVTNGADFEFLKLTIRNTAAFFSAYEVDPDHIDNLEAFLTRIVPNDIINYRTERFK